MATFVPRWAVIVLGWSLALGAAIACSSSSNNNTPPNTTTDSGTDGTTEGSVTPTDPEGMFRAFQADLIAKCGGTGGQCHVQGTFMSAPMWLGAPDPYVSCKNYPGNIPASNDPLDSKLLTQVEHEGPALISSQDLFNKVKSWVIAEIAARGPKLPATDPIAVVDGTNTFDLTALAGGLAGTTITFDASGSGGKILTILNMKITAPFPKSLHIESPFFVIIPASGPTITDTTDGFAGSLDVGNGQSTDFFGGSAVLAKWTPGAKLKVVFNKFDAVLPDDAGTGVACSNLTSFKTNATPAFKVDLGSGNTCQSCHGGGMPTAQFAMDLGALDTDPAKACSQVLPRIVPKDPTKSQLLLTPTGNAAGDPSHTVRDICPAMTTNDAGLSLCVDQATVVDALTTWINDE